MCVGNNLTRPGPRQGVRAFKPTLAHVKIWARGPPDMSLRGWVCRSLGKLLSRDQHNELRICNMLFQIFWTRLTYLDVYFQEIRFQNGSDIIKRYQIIIHVCWE